MSTFFAVPYFQICVHGCLGFIGKHRTRCCFSSSTLSVRCTITYLLLNVFSFLVNAFGFILDFLYLVAKAVVVNGVVFATPVSISDPAPFLLFHTLSASLTRAGSVAPVTSPSRRVAHLKPRPLRGN